MIRYHRTAHVPMDLREYEDPGSNSSKCCLKLGRPLRYMANGGFRRRRPVGSCWEARQTSTLRPDFLEICCGTSEMDVKKRCRSMFCAEHCFRASRQGFLRLSEPQHVRRRLKAPWVFPLNRACPDMYFRILNWRLGGLSGVLEYTGRVCQDSQLARTGLIVTLSLIYIISYGRFY